MAQESALLKKNSFTNKNKESCQVFAKTELMNQALPLFGIKTHVLKGAIFTDSTKLKMAL